MYISSELLVTYLVAITLLSITPGIDTMLVIRNSVRGGVRDGVASSFGICSGLFAHATLSAVGISIILIQAAWAFTLLKLLGAGYLVWLGVSNWRNVFRRREVGDISSMAVKNENFILHRSLREGLLSNVLNPKTAIFYMAFLPQFISPSHSALVQSLSLAAIHFVIAMVWQSLLALMVIQSKAWMFNRSSGSVFEGITGSIMIWLGWRVASEG